MEFTKLALEDYPRFLALYNEAFPPSERREYRDEKELDTFIREHKGKFHAFSAKDGDLYLGFLSYWTFKGYVYIEHFAVDPAHRGKNLGRLMLQHLFKEVSPDVLLEVERPETPDAERRIHFYEQNGFRVRKEIDYEQPPYAPDKESVKMLLMTHGDVALRNKDDIREMLREVYNVRES
ncbi:MAG: GNAT family N-acetyltransferase [Clostridium sp.]|nr:GNAT family N-acetyltransferase [Prevotella sp.]MCM1429491.1 GNAT family N-acetyltransferase [Clostridium sp.]MCM1476107.1 GNAT family N-acetyltransferase [Muribaculaceae bacterium]